MKLVVCEGITAVLKERGGEGKHGKEEDKVEEEEGGGEVLREGGVKERWT